MSVGALSEFLIGHTLPVAMQKFAPEHATPAAAKASLTHSNVVGFVFVASALHVFPAFAHVAVQDSSKAPKVHSISSVAAGHEDGGGGGGGGRGGGEGGGGGKGGGEGGGDGGGITGASGSRQQLSVHPMPTRL